MNYSEGSMRKMIAAWHPDWRPETIASFHGQQLAAIFLKSQSKFSTKSRDFGGVSRDYMLEKLLYWNPNSTFDYYMQFTDDQIYDEYRAQSAAIVAQMTGGY
jgi:hypothetical protein